MPKTLSQEPLQIRPSTRAADSPLSSTEVAYQWILKFAAITGKPADRVQQDIWTEALKDIPAERLNAACESLMKTWRYPNLPLPGDVRAQLDSADEKGFELEAATAWQELLAWIDRYYHPDIGVSPDAPPLPSAVEHACRAAGGFRWIERCGEDDLVWCRKSFLAAYRNVHETGQVEHLLGDGEVRRVLARLTAGPSERMQLAAAQPSDPPEDSGSNIPREEVGAVLCRVTAEQPKSSPEPSREELAVRWREQKERAHEWARSHGLESVPNAAS